MFTYPRGIVRFYKYKILGYDLVNIEAENLTEARAILRSFLLTIAASNPEWYQYFLTISTNDMVRILGISESLYLPVTGISKKKKDEIEYVWVLDKWIPEFEYQQKLKYVQAQRPPFRDGE